MDNAFATYRPEGFSTLNSYIFADDAPALIDYLKLAFDAEELNRIMRDGDIANCILKIGDTAFMISQARGEFTGMRTAFYLYVKDVDAMYQRAIEHGGESVFAPADMDYGDRQGGVKDLEGNYWWISTRLKEGPYSG